MGDIMMQQKNQWLKAYILDTDENRDWKIVDLVLTVSVEGELWA